MLDEKQQIKMLGMTFEEANKLAENTLISNRDSRMLVMGMLSDIQEQIDNEEIRQKLNLAKYILDTTLTGVTK